MVRRVYNPFNKTQDIAIALLDKYIQNGLSEEAAHYFFDNYSRCFRYSDIIDFAKDLDFYYAEYKKNNTWLKKLFKRDIPYCYYTIWDTILRKHMRQSFSPIREESSAEETLLSAMIASKRAMDTLQKLKEEGLRAFDD
jgi:hypothetical protein